MSHVKKKDKITAADMRITATRVKKTRARLVAAEDKRKAKKKKKRSK